MDHFWKPYVPVAQRRRNAVAALKRLLRKGEKPAPVVVEGRVIAKSFWGRSWCENLEGYGDYANRLPRGRTYCRNGSVAHLAIGPGEIVAHVSGSTMYRVDVTIAPLPKARWKQLCAACSGGIDSVVELLQGRFASGVMQQICSRETGLFPKPAEIRFKCTCPDWASMCKHVAAVLYGVGARLDHAPELFFTLRQVDQGDLIARADALVLPSTQPPAERLLVDADMSALFGLDIAATAAAKSRPGAGRARKPAKKATRR